MIEGCTEASVDVDHIIPKRMGGPDDPENLQGLCPHHHKVKTANESAFKTDHDVKRVIVCGAPASGKSTYVIERAQPGDMVWDWDCMAGALLGRKMHTGTRSDAVILKHIRDALISWLQLNADHNDVWIILRDLDEARKIRRMVSGFLQVMDTSQDECVRRIETSPDRAAVRTDQIRAVNLWFSSPAHLQAVASGGEK